ncbi:MAG: AAA family ATPase [Candidatus Sericytochromatia bacterium]|nr:AAA family ATPase [Candidatus Sericytochromatia bacterium]
MVGHPGSKAGNLAELAGLFWALGFSGDAGGCMGLSGMDLEDEEYSTQEPISFQIEGLFGSINYSIPLVREGKRVLFLTAPNGYGKSTIFRLMRDLSEENWEQIREVDFKSYSIEFAQGGRLLVERNPLDSSLPTISWSGVIGLEPGSWTPKVVDSDARSFDSRNTDDFLPPWLRRVGADMYVDLKTKEVVRRRDVLERHSPEHRERRFHQKPKGLRVLLESFKVHYLGAERIWGAQVGEERALSGVSELLKADIDDTRLRYARRSRMAEGQFIRRALDSLRDGSEPVSEKQIDDLYEKLNRDVNRFMSLEIGEAKMEYLNKDAFFGFIDNVAINKIVFLFLSDMDKRFGLFRDLADRMELFRGVVNEMMGSKEVVYQAPGEKFSFLAEGGGRHRKMVSSGSFGPLSVVDKGTGREIPLGLLSSGEKHLMVMIGNVVFEKSARDGSIILLDEPEISLHPEWQTILSKSLRKISEINKCHMLLATHSPIIVDDDWDSEVDLRSLR